MKKYLIVFIGLLLGAHAYAQNESTVSGTVIDEKKQPMPGAVIQLINLSDSTKLTATADASGMFAVKELPPGNYIFNLSFFGYNSLSRNITLSKRTNLMLGILQLLPSSEALKEVVVTARRNFMTVENDKKVFYPNALGGVASGSASDVMAQIPMVDIDKDGNVTLRGKSPQVLIDGKPSPYSDISTALQMISATAIDKIEVMTNPSAKYDAEGQGGILNIVLKKDKAQGFNGVINIDMGSYPDNHVGTDLNYRTKKLNFFGNINYHNKQAKGTQTNAQHFLQRDSATYVSQLSNVNTRNKDIDSRFGIDYFINERSGITLTQGFAKRLTDNSTDIYLDSGANVSILSLAGMGKNQTKSSNMAYNTDLNYTHHFAKSSNVLTADVIHNVNEVNSTMELNNPQLFIANQPQQNQGTSSVQSWIIQTDYTGRAGKKGKVEAGYKGFITTNKNDVSTLLYDKAANAYTYSQSLSSRFKYRENVQALYITYADSILGLNYKIGLRSELANLNGHSLLQNITFNKSFLNLFPSLYLSRDLAENQSIGLSYASRISRPSFLQLLPYINITSPISWQSGNINLSPAYTQNIEFNYSKLFTQSNNFLNLSLYYTHTSNSIQMLTVNQPGGYTLTTPQNIATDRAFGTDLIYRFNIKKAVNFTTTFDLSYNKFDGTDLYASNLNGFWNYRIHLEGNINLPDKFIFLAHGELTGPQITPQGNMNQNKGIDVELKRQFLGKRITASAIVSDLFNNRQSISHIVTGSFIEDDTYRENSRMIHVHLSYGF